MQLKLRHIILYVAACVTLWVADASGLSLLAILSLLQLAVLLQGMPFTKQAQLAELRLFLISLPAIFFWGAMHSFTHIYMGEASPVLGLMSALVTFSISMMMAFQLIFSQNYLEKNNFAVLNALSEAFNGIRNERKRLFYLAALIFLFSFVPVLAIDWKIVFSLTATLFWVHRSQLMKAFRQPF